MTYSQNIADMLKNTMDFNQGFTMLRRNIEAVAAANQVVVESVQAISRRQAEIARANIENTLKVSKDLMTSGSPETNATKTADLAKAYFENNLTNLREVSELVTKSGFEAFDVLNRRAAESLEEVSKVAGAATKKSSKNS